LINRQARKGIAMSTSERASRRVPWLAASALVIGCHASGGEAPEALVGSARSAMYGSGVADETDAGAPWAATAAASVEILLPGSGRGSGTAISPYVILTARHNTCPGHTQGRVLIVPPAGPPQGYPLGAVIAHDPPFDLPCGPNNPNVADDIALWIVDTRIAASVIAPSAYPPVFLGADPLDPNTGAPAQVLAANEEAKPDSVAWVQCGFGATNTAGGQGEGTRRCGAVDSNTLRLVFVAGGQGGGSMLVADWYADDAGADAGSIHSYGDSGGGLFVQAMRGGQAVGVPLHVGVTQGRIQLASGQTVQNWSLDGSLPITAADGSGQTTMNSSVILTDGDGDNTPDYLDNCPPWLCFNPAQCANPRQIDTDGDGWGDMCDGCPYTFDLYVGSNGLPLDSDRDGVPDSCDNCVAQPNGPVYGPLCVEPQQVCTDGGPCVCGEGGACYEGSCWAPQRDDDDQDGVGNHCDNCPETPNPYTSCTAGQPSTCGGNAQCYAGTWSQSQQTYIAIDAGAGSPGHCGSQLDADGDGLGDVCDTCPNNANNAVLGLWANSNHDAELQADAGVLWDVCDEVPTYIARPVITPATGSDIPAGTTMFSASAAVGVDHWNSHVQETATFPANGAPTAPVGFRHCDCIDNTGGPLSGGRAGCLGLLHCVVRSTEYGNALSRWRPVTVSTQPNGGDVYQPAPSLPALLRNFTSTISPSDGLPTTPDFSDNPADGLESWRIGAKERLYWRWAADVDAGHVAEPDGGIDGGPGTVGVFWSFVLQTTEFASARDQEFVNNGQSLRSMYAYLTTPTNTGPAPSFVVHVPAACPTFPCQLVIDPELQYVNPDPMAAINQVTHAPSEIVVAGPTVAMLNGNTTTAIDATGFVTPTLASDILSGSVAFVHPVETAAVSRIQGNPTLFVSYPRTWTPTTSFSRGAMVGGTIASRLAGIRSTDPPGASTGARALYSARTDTGYLVGGIGPSGAPTGQIWSFDLTRGLWNLLAFSGPTIGNVAALALDVGASRMLVLDEGDAGAWRPSRHQRRLVAYDLLARTGTPINTWPWLGQTDHATLTSMQDGTFVLLTSAHGSIDAFRFSTTGSQIQWLGHTSLQGDLLDEPYLSTAGLVAFVGVRQHWRAAVSQTVVTLTLSSFQQDGHDGPSCF
jgi:hypothetical protein